MKRFYVDGPFGQVHCIEWGEDTKSPTIICLSPSPFSSKAYLTIAPLLAEQRKVIAIDYPGFGNSDAKKGDLSINDLALVSCVVADHCSSEREVDLFGFHTGTLVAVEMSLVAPTRVGKLVLTDVPFFSPDKQAELLAGMPEEIELKPELSMLEDTWRFCVSSKLDHIPLSRAYQMFIDHISPMAGGNAVFRAAFTYPCEERFKKVTTPSWILATDSSLYEASCNTAKLIASATLVEVPNIKTAVLEAGAGQIAELTISALNGAE